MFRGLHSWWVDHSGAADLSNGLGLTNARGAAAGSWWTVQFLIRRCAWHMLDHAWEMEDRDLP
jgi:hypothetical protein